MYDKKLCDEDSRWLLLFTVTFGLAIGALIVSCKATITITILIVVLLLSFIMINPFFGICILVFSVPFAGLMKILPDVLTVNKLLGVYVAISLIVNVMINHSYDNPKISTPMLLYFTTIFLCLPSLIWSFDPMDGLGRVSSRLSVVGMALLISIVIQKQVQLKILCWSATFGSTLLGMYVVIFGVDELVGEYRERLAGGTNENVLAHALAVGLMLSIFLFFKASRKSKALILLMDFFIVAAIGMTGSRGTWLSLSAGLTVAVFLNSDLRLRARIALLSVSFLAVVGVAYGVSRDMFGYFGVMTLKRISMLTESSSLAAGSGGRMSFIWPMYLEEIMKRPLFGGGLDVRYFVGRASHNDILNILAELGLMGLVTFLFMYLSLWKSIRRIESRGIRTASLSLLIFLLVGGATHNTLYLKSYAIVVGVLCSLPSIYSRKNETICAQTSIT